MGVEARFQAIPEDCELLQRARQDQKVAEWMQFFDDVAREIRSETWQPSSEEESYFGEAVRNLFRLKPGLIERYYYAGGRTFDAIVYLLSSQRRAGDRENDSSLIYEAIYGSELLHSEARATQGYPIGFMPSHTVETAVTYLNSITYEYLHKYYNPAEMVKAGVYKIHPTDDETTFQYIWKEFVGMRNVYRAAADHREAVIIVID